jgi:hypothetical protein
MTGVGSPAETVRRRSEHGVRMLRARGLSRPRQVPARPAVIAASAAGLFAGIALARLTDPVAGKRRRRMLRDRSRALALRGVRRTRRSLHHGSKDAYGLAQRAIHRLPHPERDLDDATLRDKVQSILFRDRRIPKGEISVNAERGWIYLRGQIHSPELIRQIGEQAASIEGVRGVKNLLHTPAA